VRVCVCVCVCAGGGVGGRGGDYSGGDSRLNFLRSSYSILPAATFLMIMISNFWVCKLYHSVKPKTKKHVQIFDACFIFYSTHSQLLLDAIVLQLKLLYVITLG